MTCLSGSQHRLPRARVPPRFILFAVTKSLCRLLRAIISILILRLVGKGEHISICISPPLPALVPLDSHPGVPTILRVMGVHRASTYGGALLMGPTEVVVRILAQGYIVLEEGASFSNSSAGTVCFFIIPTVVPCPQAVALDIQEAKQETVRPSSGKCRVFRSTSWALGPPTIEN